MSPLVQSETFEEYMQTEHRPIRGGSPEADAPAGGDDQGAAEAPVDSGLYDLDSVDPEIREQLTPHLKAIEGNVTKKLQEAADFRKGWEPYDALGVRDMEPDALKQLLEFAQMAQDPEQFGLWWKATGEQLGLYQPDQDLNLEGLDLDELGGVDGLSEEKIQELVAEMVQERLNPLEAALQEQQQSQLVEAANQELQDSLAKAEADHPSLFEGDAEAKEAVKETITRLAYTYSTENDGLSMEELIAKGVEDYQALLARGEKGAFEQKKDSPPAPEGAGSAVATADRPTSFDDPRLKEQALARMRQT